MNYYDCGLETLADQIIITAAKDYMNVLRAVQKNPSNKKALREKTKLEMFFTSRYCKNISKADPVKIMSLCQKSL